MSKAIVESLKEASRLFVFGVVGLLVSLVVEVVLPSLDQTSVIVALTLVLRAADKYVHTTDKTKLKGLVPF